MSPTQNQEPAAQLTKPLLRGYFHQEAFFAALGACVLLLAKCTSGREVLACSIYSFGLLFLFGTSAIYHRPHWQPKSRALLKRIDHAAIFILIAGTASPIALLALPENEGLRLLLTVWSASLVGVVQSVFWIKAPKWLTALLYVIAGWLSLPYLPQLQVSLSGDAVLFLVLGGVVYTLGAVFYALKRPNFAPGIFGYHELFHLLTIVGAIFHFIVVYQLL